MRFKKITTLIISFLLLSACGNRDLNQIPDPQIPSQIEEEFPTSESILEGLKKARGNKKVNNDKAVIHDMTNDEFRNYATMARIYQISYDQEFSHEVIMEYIGDEYNIEPQYAEDYLFANIEAFEQLYDKLTRENKASEDE